jgi:hypothetical protein
MRVAVPVRVDALHVENVARHRPATAQVSRTLRLRGGDSGEPGQERGQPADVTTSLPAGSVSAPAAVNTIS